MVNGPPAGQQQYSMAPPPGLNTANSQFKPYNSTTAVPSFHQPGLSPWADLSSKKKKKVESRKYKERMLGKLKFFSAKDKYGFIVCNTDGTDLFVHYDDLRKAQMDDNLLMTFKGKLDVSVQFCIFEYSNKQGRIKKKAVDIKLLEVKELPNEAEPSPESNKSLIS